MMGKRLNILLYLFVLLLLSPDFLFAQQTSSGTIRGQVTDAKTGDPLPGVTLIIKGTINGSVTDLDGNYVLSKIPTGSHTIVASFIGYKVVEETVIADSISITTQDFYLKLDYRAYGNVFHSILISFAWLAIALIYLGLYTQNTLKPLITFTIPRFLLPGALGIYGIATLLKNDFDLDVNNILNIILSVMYLTFSLSGFIRKKINETALILAGALILQSLIILLFVLIDGYFSKYVISSLLENFVLAGGTLTYAGVYANNTSGISITQKLKRNKT